MKEAIDYGFIPKSIRDRLTLSSESVSRQIINLISFGVVGIEAFPVSVRIAETESLFFAKTSPTADERALHLNVAAQCKEIRLNPELQIRACEIMMDRLNNLALKANLSNQPAKAKLAQQGAQNWNAARSGIKAPIMRSQIRLVRPGE